MKHVANKRILIVEDSAMIGEVIADNIAEAGGWPLGPAFNPRDALDMINFNPGSPDAAVLDLHMHSASFSVAERLDELGIPFIFAASSKLDAPEAFGHISVCEKPYATAHLIASLEGAFAKPGRSLEASVQA